MRMKLGPRGELLLVIPQNLPLGKVRLLSSAFLPWLEKHLAAAQFTPARIEFPKRLDLPLLGKNMHIRQSADIGEGKSRVGAFSILFVEEPKRILVNLDGEAICFYGRALEPDLCISALRAFARHMASIVLPPMLRKFAAAYEEVEVRVRDQKSRWASCSRKKDSADPARINLNWRALLLSPQLFEHLCWHELAHLRHMNHSAAFYGELAAHSPHWRESEKGLDGAWRSLPGWAAPDFT